MVTEEQSRDFMPAESLLPAQCPGDSQSWPRWEMAASDQSEGGMVTSRPIRGQPGDTDSTVQTPEISHQREKLGNIPSSSHHLGIASQIKHITYVDTALIHLCE